MDHRRGHSLGKSYLRAVARIPRTLSFTHGSQSRLHILPNAEERPNNNDIQPMASGTDAEDWPRVSRASMRRMVRFRMSNSPDNDLSSGSIASDSVSRQMAETSASSEMAGGAERGSSSEGDQRYTSETPSWPTSEGEELGYVSQLQSFHSQSALIVDDSFVDGIRPHSVLNREDSANSGLSVMSIPLESATVSTIVDSPPDVTDRRQINSTRRQRGRAGRNHDSYHRSRTRRRRSNNDSSTSGSRNSSPEPPVARTSRRRSRSNAEGNVDPEEESRRRFMGVWPHKASALFAMLATTLGVFNLSRFALLTISFGGNFLIQFVLLTLIFGIPLLCFSACLGQFLGSGVIDMWKISPIFKGVGLSLLLAQALVGIYSVVGVAWMFFYFRDSFIAPEDRYKWEKCHPDFRNCSSALDFSARLEETVPDYFQGRVLQRTSATQVPSSFVSLKFEISFNLAVIWMIVFIALSKGLRSYGKVAYAFGTFPLLGYLIVCFKMLGISSNYPTKFGSYEIFDQTAWNEFFTNTKCWVAAGREVFLTWGFFGAVVMQICAHNRYRHNLRRDITFVIVITLFVLLLSGFLATSCIQMLSSKQAYVYFPSSFETIHSYLFLKNDRSSSDSKILLRNFQHNNFLTGMSILPPSSSASHAKSYYQPMRLATEIFPALVSVLGSSELSPFWAVLFYFSLVTFGIAQQLAIWYCVINGIVAFRACCLKSWETTITFCACACGFLTSLPLATELGVSIMYFMDYAVGSSWWLMIIYVIQIAAVLIVRGRPYNSERIVAVFIRGSGCMANWCNPLLTFCWSVVLPAGLIVLSVASFKMGDFRDLYTWKMNEGYVHWPLWVRQCGCMINLVPLLLVPLIGITQSFYYLCKSHPSDLFDRIKLLYRPNFRTFIVRPDRPEPRRPSRRQQRRERRHERSRSPSPPGEAAPDPPPKYTPPPTYNTATGARIAKLLRESFRRSVRQIRNLAAPNQSTTSTTAELELGQRSVDVSVIPVASQQLNLPPSYTAVIMEIVRTGAPSQSDIVQSQENPFSNPSCGPEAAGTSAVNITRILRESFRRSIRARESLRSSFRLFRDQKQETSREDAVEIQRERDTDYEVVHNSTPIHRECPVISLPHGSENSESVA